MSRRRKVKACATPRIRPKSGTGKCQFTPDLRRFACEAYKYAYLSERPDAGPVASIHQAGKGRKGDEVWSKAFKNFMTTHGHSFASPSCPRPCTKTTFIKVVKRWLQRETSLQDGQQLVRASQAQRIGLSDSEVKELASLLGQPVIDDKCGSCKYFVSIEDAAVKRPRVRELVTKATVSTSALHRLLVEERQFLTYSMVDEVPVLPPRTLESREKAAEVWGCRKPWFVGHPSSTRSEHCPDVFWDPRWYEQFTFIIDATSFEDGATSAVKCKDHVYRDKAKVYGPTHVTDAKHVAATTKVMVYCIIHPYGGLVCGPDIMYTGSKIPRVSNDEKQDARKEELLPTWCAHVCLHFYCWRGGVLIGDRL